MYLLENSFSNSLGGIILFFVLFSIYLFVFKVKKWTPSANTIINKIRFLCYLSIIILSLWWISLKFMSYPFVEIGNTILGYILLTFSMAIVIQAVISIIFDIKMKGMNVPVIYRQILTGLLYGIFFIIILGKVSGIKLVDLLTTSAIVSIVIGLALQDTLGNIFAGIVLNISKPYSIGDWVNLENEFGKIERIDWRSTALSTFSGDYIIYPNSSLAKMRICNFTSPSRLHRKIIKISVSYEHQPAFISQVLRDVAKDTDGVSDKIEPSVLLSEFSDSAITYELRFWITDFSIHREIESSVMEKIWYSFKREEIKIPFPIRDVYLHRVKEEKFPLPDIMDLLKKIDLFSCLEEEDIKQIAVNSKINLYTKDEIIFKQGSYGETMYIIKNGTVQVKSLSKEGEVLLNIILKPGNFFGELGAFTGEPRSATIKAMEDTILILVNKNNLAKIMKRNNEFQKNVSKCIARMEQEHLRRKKALKEQIDETIIDDNLEGQVKSLSESILSKITLFFGY